MNRSFTLVEEIRSKESEDFHNGRVECFDVDYEWQFKAYEAMYRALEGE